MKLYLDSNADGSVKGTSYSLFKKSGVHRSTYVVNNTTEKLSESITEANGEESEDIPSDIPKSITQTLVDDTMGISFDINNCVMISPITLNIKIPFSENTMLGVFNKYGIIKTFIIGNLEGRHVLSFDIDENCPEIDPEGNADTVNVVKMQSDFLMIYDKTTQAWRPEIFNPDGETPLTITVKVIGNTNASAFASMSLYTTPTNLVLPSDEDNVDGI